MTNEGFKKVISFIQNDQRLRV